MKPEKRVEKLRICDNCGHMYAGKDNIVDVGGDFAAEFRFCCPKCKKIGSSEEGKEEDKNDSYDADWDSEYNPG